MPQLNVSGVLLDPRFCEALVVYRRLQTLVKGRTVITATLVTPAPYGVVLPVADQPLQRGPDQQNLPRLLEIHTPYRLRSASRNLADTQQYQPDIIVWSGDQFLVNKIGDYSKYGRGFIMAEASSIDPIDLEPQQ